jgi:hypothetical protein
MARSRIRSAEDATGRRLIRAGQTLIRTGTAVEEVTIADVLQLIEVEDGVRWSAGAVYPRFHTQEGLRNAVLVQMVKDGPHHRDHALSLIGRQLLGFPEDGVLDLDEPAEGEAKATPADIADMIDVVATEQQRLLRDDPEVAIRQYARARIESATDEPTARLREELLKVDETTSQDWRRLLEKLCEDLELRAAGAPDELSLADFETALSCLLDGIAVRQKTQPVRDGLYAKLVMALAIGFLEPERTPRLSMKERFVKHMSTRRRDPRRLVKTREHWVQLRRTKVEQEQEHEDAAPLPLDRLRPSVARAIAANARD